MGKKWGVIVTIIGFIIIGGGLAGPVMSAVETPNYVVIASDDQIEIRQYPPMIQAVVIVEGPRKQAVSAGFRLLADYIFGNNSPQQDISMNAPVEQRAVPAQDPHKIAMTAPVQQQAAQQKTPNNLWQISFIMPATYTLQTLPIPNNAKVTLQQTPATKFVVIRFSGIATDARIARHENQLRAYVTTHRMQTIGAPKYAFYNPPWTLPFLRRNEVMLAVEG